MYTDELEALAREAKIPEMGTNAGLTCELTETWCIESWTKGDEDK